MKILIAPDKFKGTATATQLVDAVLQSKLSQQHKLIGVPLADGGDGTLEAFGGANRNTEVTGPMGNLIMAAWRLDGETATIEMAKASGLVLAGGSENNDPIKATTKGTGELISEAVLSGATRIIAGLGGSATTDGGLGAIQAIGDLDLSKVEILVACDVRTKFIDAAKVFGPQKGATSEQILELTSRLEKLSEQYLTTYGFQVANLERSGAAGGLSGGLAAIGAKLVDGFGLISQELDLESKIAEADLIITGEGSIDDSSFNGKVVGEITNISKNHGKPVLAIAGCVETKNIPNDLDIISLADEFGVENCTTNTAQYFQKSVAKYLS